jgi:hypothetical protein
MGSNFLFNLRGQISSACRPKRFKHSWMSAQKLHFHHILVTDIPQHFAIKNVASVRVELYHAANKV